MAGASLLALIDDIASLLDDVATMTKVATEKTAGVLGDDLALDARQVTGVRADRELPVVWVVAKGSMLNKAILVPLTLAIAAFAPWAVTPLQALAGVVAGAIVLVAVGALRRLRPAQPQVGGGLPSRENSCPAPRPSAAPLAD